MSAQATAAMLAAVGSGPFSAAGGRGVRPWLTVAHVRAGEAAWEAGGAPRRRPTALVCLRACPAGRGPLRTARHAATAAARVDGVFASRMPPLRRTAADPARNPARLALTARARRTALFQVRRRRRGASARDRRAGGGWSR